jgi:oligopeptide transport system substrate-binding protein
MKSARHWTLPAIGLICVLGLTSCTVSSADSEFFGKTDPPPGQLFRYITGDEPESIDPQIPTGQPEARILMSLYEGLAEYDPKTMAPIPAIAERWESNADFSEAIFYLRKNARFSNGDPITAHDFVYSFQRGLSPQIAARNAYLAYYIVYAQGYNEAGVFARDPVTNEFVMDGKFRRVFPGDEPGRRKLIDADANLKATLAGKEFVPVKAEDIGVVAVDDYTLKISLIQSAPFFISLTPHQFFRVIHRKTIEKYGDDRWTRPENIVTSGPFKMKEWIPYDKIIVVRDPMYWDAANVKLDEIRFYPLVESTTMMNLYKAGDVDATYNHTVPVAWLDIIESKKDYMDAPEVVNEYYQINTTKPPMNDARVRKAFNLSIDKNALAKFQHAKPLMSFVPEGIFPGYPAWKEDTFDPERAKQLLAEAGYKDASGKFDPSKFPIRDIELTYNTSDRNQRVTEFVQAQWKQNLGLTVPIKNMEFKTFLASRAALDYKGLARSGWIGDYMDPFSYLNIFYTPRGDNGTGWWDPKYVAILDDANKTLDPALRYEKMFKAEQLLLESQAVIPLMEQSTSWMKKPYVKGMYPNPGTMHAWKYVYIEHDPTKWDYGVPDLTPTPQ